MASNFNNKSSDQCLWNSFPGTNDRMFNFNRQADVFNSGQRLACSNFDTFPISYHHQTASNLCSFDNQFQIDKSSQLFNIASTTSDARLNFSGDSYNSFQHSSPSALKDSSYSSDILRLNRMFSSQIWEQIPNALVGSHLQKTSKQQTHSETSWNDCSHPSKEIPKCRNSRILNKSPNLSTRNHSIDCISNPGPFKCPICFNIIASCKGIVLRNCSHVFCRDCLQTFIELCEDAQVRCPFGNIKYHCQSFLQDREVCELSSVEIYRRYIKRNVDASQTGANEKSFPCKTRHCNGWYVRENEHYSAIFECPTCKVKHCVSCQDVHPGLTCFQFRKMQQNEG